MAPMLCDVWHLQYVFNIGKENTVHRPDEAILFVLVKACLQLEIFLFTETLITLFFL